MTDIVSKKKRSEMMSGIKGRDTKPEIKVRSVLHGMGYRFRLHVKDLPGKPDIVLRRLKTVVLVHGCFWHRHRGCKLAYCPKTRKSFWMEKFDSNIRRDRLVTKQLKQLGWAVIVVWECDLKKPERMQKKLLTPLYLLRELSIKKGN